MKSVPIIPSSSIMEMRIALVELIYGTYLWLVKASRTFPFSGNATVAGALDLILLGGSLHELTAISVQFGPSDGSHKATARVFYYC